jgi:hypothetical protein
MRHIGRAIAAALVAVAVILPCAGLRPAPVAAAVTNPVAGCPGGHQAWANVAGTVTHQSYISVYTGGGSPQTYYQYNSSSSALRLNYDFCTNKGSVLPNYWYIYAAGIAGTTDVGIDSGNNVTGANGMGYALRPYEVIGGVQNSVIIQNTYCTQSSNPFTSLALVAGLPIPGVSYAFSVGQWIASSVFAGIPGPSGKCRGLGTVSLPISINSNGGTTVGSGGGSYYFDRGKWDGWASCNSGAWNCEVIERFVFSLRQA